MPSLVPQTVLASWTVESTHFTHNILAGEFKTDCKMQFEPNTTVNFSLAKLRL